MSKLETKIYNLEAGASTNCLLSVTTCDEFSSGIKPSISINSNLTVNEQQLISEELCQTKENIEKRSNFYGYFMGILCALCFSLTNILMKQCPTLIGSDHSFIRYFFQLFVMLYIIKYKNLICLGLKKERPILVIRAFISIDNNISILLEQVSSSV